MLIDCVNEEYWRFLEAVSRVDEVAVDCETTGLDIWKGDRICGVAIYHPEIGAAYLPFRHGEGRNLPPDRLQDVWRVLQGKKLVNHNIKFDVEVMWLDGFGLPERVEDTMLAAHLMNENEYKRNEQGRVIYRSGGKPATDYSLAALAQKYLGQADTKDQMDEILKARGLGKGDLWRLPPELVEPYAVGDVALAWQLRDFYVPYLRLWRLYDLWQEVNEYCLIIAKMEIRGMQLDRDLIHRYMAEARQMQEQVRYEIQQMAGWELNPNSPKQVQAWLGLPSTSRKYLDALMVMLPEDDPRRTSFDKLLEHRAWAKVNGTYYQPYLELCDEHGAIRPHFLLHGTVSGRLSCHEPNLQAVPRYSKVYKVKDVFVARPGYTMVSADYSQAEIRWGTHYAREQNMARNLLEGLDIHSVTAEMLNIPRDAAKRINFGIIYGIGAKSLAEQLLIPEEQAAEYLRRYHSLYPGFRALLRKAEQVAEERGYIRMFTGRVRRYDEHSPARKASSNLIQGAVAEMIRLAVQKLDRLLAGTDSHMLLQVHDQIIFEIPQGREKELIPVIREGMERFSDYADQLMVPMKVDISVGPSWGQMTEWKEGGTNG